MKKLTRFSVLGFVAAAFLIGGVAIAQAESNSRLKYRNLWPLPADRVSPADKMLPVGRPIPDEGGGMTSSNRGQSDKPVLSGNRLETTNNGKNMADDKSRLETTNRGETGNPFENFARRFEHAVKNLEAVHDRISKLAERIESRMKKLSSENIDVSAGLKFAAGAREELRLAKASMEAARISFKTEFTASADKADAVNKADIKANTIYGGKTQWSTKMFKICVANKGTLLKSDPMRCSFDGRTYVNADQPVETADTTETEIAASADKAEVSSATDRINNVRATLTKTMENIRLAREHLKKAHQNLVQAIVSFKPGINREGEKKINGEFETGPSASTEINSNN